MPRDQATALICNCKGLVMGMRVSVAANKSALHSLHERSTRVETMMLWLFWADRKPASSVVCVWGGDHFHFTPWLQRRFSVLSVFYGAAPELMLPRTIAATWAGTMGCVVGSHAQGQLGATCAAGDKRAAAHWTPTAKSKALFLLPCSNCIISKLKKKKRAG